jgi:hypothetical protein
VIFRPLPGHGGINARTLAALGWARFARTDADLRAVLGAAHVPSATRIRSGAGPFDGADPVPVILDLAGSRPRPLIGRADVRP